MNLQPWFVLSGKGYVMRKFVLAAVLVLMAGGAQAASYQQKGGAIVDPIQFTTGGNHFYSGANLQPGANLESAT
jgi:hypothetical protein